MDGVTIIQGGAAMIPQNRLLLTYASNFLESEIEKIERLLKCRRLNAESREVLTQVLNEYKHDLEVIENEIDRL